MRLPGEKPAVTPECGHRFHDSCFKEFTLTYDKCSICRKPLKMGGDSSGSGKLAKVAALRGERLKQSAETTRQNSIKANKTHQDRCPPEGLLQNDPNDDDPLDGSLHHLANAANGSSQHVILPRLSVKSEFPTIAKSDQPQQLACLVTIEMPSRYQALPPSTPPSVMQEYMASPPMSPPTSPRARSAMDKSLANGSFDLAAGELADRVQDWKGQSIQSFGRLLLYDTLTVTKDYLARQYVVYLFETVLICVKEKKGSKVENFFGWNEGDQRAQAAMQKKAMRLKGRIYVRHIQRMLDTSASHEHSLTLHVGGNSEINSFTLVFPSRQVLERWQSKLGSVMDPSSANSLSGGIASHVGSSNGSTASIDGLSSEGFSYGATPPSRAGPMTMTPTPSMTSMTSMTSMNGHKSPTISHRQYPSLDESSNLQIQGLHEQQLFTQHTPIDLVIVCSAGPSMQGLKLRLLKDALRFIFHQMGPRDRVSLVTFGSAAGMRTLDSANGHANAVRRTPLLTAARPDNLKTLERVLEDISISTSVSAATAMPGMNVGNRVDVLGGVNLGLDVILQRQSKNPLTGMFVLSDAPDINSAADLEILLGRAEAAGLAINTFGFGITHQPANLYTIAQQTRGTYTYIKDWYQVRDCLAGCLGGMFAIAAQKTRLRLKVPNAVGPGGFRLRRVPTRGATTTPDHAVVSPDGLDGEIELGDLRYGEKRDILVTMDYQPDPNAGYKTPYRDSLADAAMSGFDFNDEEYDGVDELPVFEADISFVSAASGKQISRLPYPNLLTIMQTPFVAPATVTKQPLPGVPSGSPVTSPRNGPPSGPPSNTTPSDINVTLRRMELLAADMILRALQLAARKNHNQAHRVLIETKSIIAAMGNRTAITLSGYLNAGESINHIKATSPALVPFNNLSHDLNIIAEYIPSQPEVFDRDSRKLAMQQAMILQTQTSWMGAEKSSSSSGQRLQTERYYFEKSAGDVAALLVAKSVEWAAHFNVHYS